MTEIDRQLAIALRIIKKDDLFIYKKDLEYRNAYIWYGWILGHLGVEYENDTDYLRIQEVVKELAEFTIRREPLLITKQIVTEYDSKKETSDHGHS